MRRFVCILLLAALVATSLLAAAPASAAPAEIRNSPPPIWQVLLDLLRPLFGADEGDGRPEIDPNGLVPPPPAGGGAEDSGESDGSPQADPDG